MKNVKRATTAAVSSQALALVANEARVAIAELPLVYGDDVLRQLVYADLG